MTAMPDTGATEATTSTYDEFYYRHYDGDAYVRDERWTSFFGGIAQEIVDRLEPESVLDAGCAIGLLVEALVDRGVDAHGIDVSDYAISQVPDALRDRCTVRSLAEPLGRSYDLITTIEVIEHIEEPDLSRALDNLCAATDRLLVSSTPYHYDDPTHVSIRQPERWSRELARRGFVRDLSFDAGFISPWAALYVRSSKSWPEIVEDYDRQFWYDRREIHTTREGIIAIEGRVRDLEAELEAVRDEDASARVHALEHEVLRLRDELIGALAAKGNARGLVTQLQAEVSHARELAAAAMLERERLVEHIEEIHSSTTWRIGHTALAPVRALRGRT